jgi:hypothetical protein
MDIKASIDQYIELLKFKCPVRCIYTEINSLTTRKEEILIYPSVFDDCPSTKSLINAIEKKASKSEPIRGNPTVVPLCIILLCSKGYSINSSCFENIDDILIERCWENLKVISHSTEFPLQEWMERIMDKRNAATYSAQFCQPQFREVEIEYVSIDMPRSTRFSYCSDSDSRLPQAMWNKDDVVTQTILLHMRSFISDTPNNT